MTKKELRKISLQFRTLSSQMLKVNSQEEIIYIRAFYNYITETPFIYEYILSCHHNDYDFETIFKELGYRDRLVLPVDQADLIDYEYQLIQFVLTGKRQLFFYGEHYTSSNKFADMITAFMRKVIEPFVVALRSYLEISLIDADDSEAAETVTEKTIFLSYCQRDSDIADLIDNHLREKLKEKARISRDIRDIAFHESFGQFMRTIQDHDFVILLISDHYLKSRNCMFEVLEAIKDSRFENKIIFIVLKDEDKSLMAVPCEESIAANVYNPAGQTQYTLYWKQKENELQAQIDEIGDPTYAISQIKEKRIVAKILLDLPELIEFVRDSKGLPLSAHISEDFSSILKFMGLLD